MVAPVKANSPLRETSKNTPGASRAPAILTVLDQCHVVDDIFWNDFDHSFALAAPLAMPSHGTVGLFSIADLR